MIIDYHINISQSWTNKINHFWILFNDQSEFKANISTVLNYLYTSMGEDTDTTKFYIQ